jgi:hypothetical protein
MVIMAILILAIAVPVFADDGKVPVGTRVNLWAGDAVLNAGEPFHVQHGYVFPPKYLQENDVTAIGKTDFSLAIDGVDQDGRFISFKDEDGWLFQLTLYNYPDGLPAGQYTLAGTYQDLCWMNRAWGIPCDGHKNDTIPDVVEIQLTVVE